MKPYRAVWLENDFIKVMLLPELGAYPPRLRQGDESRFRLLQRSDQAGAGGAGRPLISGGIEFNWPQHHRPTTFMPVDFTIAEHEGGAKTVWLGEVEPMRGLQVMAGFTLYPDKALIEITGKVFNGNDTPRHFLWWSNPAVKGAMPTRASSRPMSPPSMTTASATSAPSPSPVVPTTRWTTPPGSISPVTAIFRCPPLYGGQVRLRLRRRLLS